MGSYRVCMCFTRKFRFKEAAPPEDVRAAFDKYADGGAQMTVDQLRRFLVEEQGEAEEGAAAAAEAAVQQILQRRHHIAKFTRHALTLDDFHHYLFSPDLNPAMNTEVLLWDSFDSSPIQEFCNNFMEFLGFLL